MKTAKEILEWARRIKQWTGFLRTEPDHDHWHEAEDLARAVRMAEEMRRNKFGNARWYLEAALIDAKMTNGWIDWQSSVEIALKLMDEAEHGKETKAAP